MEEFLNLLKNDLKKKEVFIGRRSIIKKIEEIYNKNKIVNIYGIGGIGKSTLLKETKNILNEKGVKVFSFDFNNFTTTEEFFENIYIWLCENDIKAHYFTLAFYIYWQKKHPNETFSDYKETNNTSNKIFNFLIEDLGIIINNILPIDITNINNIINKFKHYSIKFKLNKEILEYIENLQNLEYFEIEQYLPIFLGIDIEKYQTAFLFDTFEKLKENITTKKTNSFEWINNFILTVSKASFIIVAGREKVNFPNCDYIYLDSLKEDDTKKLIKKLGINDEKIIEKIAKSSKGHPFYITLAVDMYKKNKKSFDTEIIKKEHIFNRFVQSLTENDIQKLEILSVARMFDEDLFKYMYGKNYSSIIFQDLLSYSFISKNNQFYSMHELMRDSFLLKISKKRKQELHKEMFNYFYSKGIKNLNKLFLKEAIYHLMNFADFDFIKKWYEDLDQILEKKGEYHFLIELYKEGFHLCNQKAFFLIKEALIGLEIKNYKILNSALAILPYVKMSSEYLDAYYFLERRQTYLYSKKLPKNKIKKKFLKSVRKKYKNLELKIKDPHIKVLFLIDKAKFYAKVENNPLEGINILIKALKIAPNQILKSKILDILAKMQFYNKNIDNALELALESLKIKENYFETNHIQLGYSYELLSLIYSENDIQKTIEYITKAIKIFSIYYSKWHPKLQKLYNRLAFKVDEEFIIKNNFELDLYYLFHLLKLLQQNKELKDIVPLINKIKEITEDKNKIDSKIIKFMLTNSNNKPDYEKFALDYFNEIIKDPLSDFEKRNIYYALYQSFTKLKKLDLAEEYLKKVIDVSKNSLGNLYIVSLIEMIKFTKHTKKDYEKTVYYYEILINAQKDDIKKIESLIEYSKYVKNEDKKLKLLNQALEIANKENNLVLINEVLDEIAHYYLTKENEKEFLKIYNEMIENYKKNEDLLRIDKIYGIIADYYLDKENFEKVLEYYDKQIEIRKKINDKVKIIKGYKFKADLYYHTLNDLKNAIKNYEEALKFIDDIEVESFMSISKNLIEIYDRLKLKTQKEKLINKRIEITKKFGDERNICYAFISKLENEFKLELFKEYLNSLNFFKYKKDLIIHFLKDIGQIDIDYANDLMFYLYKNFLLYSKIEQAQKSFIKLKKYFNKYPKEKYLKNFYNISYELINNSKYHSFAYLVKHYKDLFEENFLDKKYLDKLNLKELKALFNEFKNLNLFDEAIKINNYILENRLDEMEKEEKEIFLNKVKEFQNQIT